MTGESKGIELRPLVSPAEYAACVALQRLTWGPGFGEEVPPAILKVAQRVGGVCVGAFDASELVGFVFGLTGIKEGAPVHWSHMLAVRPELRNAGIGAKLKQYQREILSKDGIETMFWTFDPLVARNAHLNLVKLGVEVEEYVEDMYPGDDRGSLDAVIGTDRLVVRWNLRNEAVPGHSCAPEANTVTSSEGTVIDPADMTFEESEAVLIAIPLDIHELKAQDPGRARQWRRSTRAAFQFYLSRGYRVTGFGHDGKMATYRLGASP